jgi:hypothetical protein
VNHGGENRSFSAGPELRLPNGWSLPAEIDGNFSGQT